MSISIFEAAKQGNVTEIKKLLKPDTDIDCQDQDQWTALHYAAMNGQLNAVEFLLEKNANINCPGSLGRTPLHIAVLYGHKQVVEKLLEKKADVNAKDIRGLSALHVASQFDNQEALELLVKYKGDINAVNKFGSTPAHSAATGIITGTSSWKTMEWLLRHESKPFATDSTGDSVRDVFLSCDWSYAEQYDVLLAAVGCSNDPNSSSN